MFRKRDEENQKTFIKTIKENTQKTYGIVLVTGPTGSGKTTTLYSILNILNRPEVNIVTIEDPIEYDIQYVNQTQINPQAGITFANGLRAILRSKPLIKLFLRCVRDFRLPNEHRQRLPARVGRHADWGGKLAGAGDTVIICGKGHEQSMCYGKTEYPWDERQAVNKALSA